MVRGRPMAKKSQAFSNLPQDLQSVLKHATSSVPAPPFPIQEALAEWALIHLSITLESSIRDKFYALALSSTNGPITPSDETHCNNILLSINGGDKYIAWSKFPNLIEQSRFYLGDNNGISNVLTTHKDWLIHLQASRNFAAHNSQESRNTFHKQVVGQYFKSNHVSCTSPGSFFISEIDRGQLQYRHYTLLYYFAVQVDQFLADLSSI